MAEPAGGRWGEDLARKGCAEIKGEVSADGEYKAGTAAIELSTILQDSI